MDLFVTKIKLKREISKEQIYNLIFKWLIGSPHYGIKEINYNNEDFKEYEFGNRSLKIINKKILDKDILAVRFVNIEKDNIWRTDFIYSLVDESNTFSIKLSCEKNNYSNVLPKIHKPHIIKMLFKEGYCDNSGSFPITDSPIFLDDNDLNTCAKIMLGSLGTDLPVVYVSYDSYSGTGYNVDYNSLALKLSGIAHILVEPNKEFSFKLKDLSNDRNAHNGYIGVYFSGANYKVILSYHEYFKNGILDQMAFADAIRLLLQQALLNHSGVEDFTWDKVLVEYHKLKFHCQQLETSSAEEEYSKLLREADNESKEYEELIKAAESESKELKERVYSLMGQLDSQSAQIESLKNKLEQNSVGIIKVDDFEEFYQDEVLDCVLNLLTQCSDKLPQDTRVFEIVQYILNKNQFSNIGKSNFIELKDAVYEKSVEQRRKKLERCGFTIIKSAHDKLIYKNDNRYIFTASNSPSDYRESDNLFSDMMKRLDIYKKFF